MSKQMNTYQRQLVNQLGQGNGYNIADFTNFLSNDDTSGTTIVNRNKMLVTDDHLEKMDFSKMTDLEIYKYNLDNENVERKKAKGEQKYRENQLRMKWEQERLDNRNILEKVADSVGDAFGSITKPIGNALTDNPLTRGISSITDSFSSLYNNFYLYLLGLIVIIIIVKKI